jgi:mannose-6-phosphate isomerase-like protein (cupin superfamily)
VDDEREQGGAARHDDVRIGILRAFARPYTRRDATSDHDVKGVPMSGYEVAHLDEIDELDDGRCPWRPVRHHFGITGFGINAWTARNAGDRIINEHDESDDENEELYFVVNGRAVFELDGERLDAPAGTFVFARPDAKRTAFAEEPGTTIIAVGGVPGKPYEPVGWEVWAPLRPLYEAGEYAAVADRGREIVEANPHYAEPLYNLACCESLAGRTTDAIEHLRQAIDRSERLRSFAREDSDLDPIRDEPTFKELVGG